MKHLASRPGHRAWIAAVAISVLAHAGLLGALGGKPLNVKSSPLVAPVRVTLQLHQAQISSGYSESATDQEPSAEADVEAAIATDESPSDTLPSQAMPPSPEAATTVGAYYFPTEALTVKPVFLHAAGAPNPMFIPDVMPLPVLAHVYISEHGQVDAVVLNDNFLSDTARQFIEASFIAMEFSPGLLGTLPVKSELTIEVKLDPTLPVQ